MAAVMPQIEHIVFLMMENRSLDNVLGWLYEGRAPANFYPSANRSPYDGLIEGKFKNPAWSGLLTKAVKQYPVTKVATANLKYGIPYWDPYEALKEGDWNGVMNQLFGDQDKIKGLPAAGTSARMQGFLQDYYASYMTQWQGLDVLWTFTPSQLPVLNGLAYNFAVSDAWFCSLPSQTNPNRAFSICGTSLGRESNAPLAVEKFDVPTLFNALAAAGKSWGLYYEVPWLKTGKCFTDYTFPQIAAARDGKVAKLATFYTDVANDTLPAFTYIEPKWGGSVLGMMIQGDDYHPPTRMGPAETLISNVFAALKKSDIWDKTLFIVTFDEHGGTYDHVPPSWGAINPDGKNGTSGFKFDLFGVRVPTILASPYIAPYTVFRAPAESQYPFDHTSFIKTFLLWAGVNPATVNLGKRMPAAPTFEGVLSDQVVNTGALPPPAVEAEAPADFPGIPMSIDDLVGDLPHAAARAVMYRSANRDEVHAAAERYRQDPEKFEEELEKAQS